MRVPHTIPKIILRAYTRKLNEEQLQKSYEGRLLISEDPTWDKDLPPTLAKQCLDLILDDFLFYNKLVEYFNELKLQEYEENKSKWEADLAAYVQRKASFDARLIAFEKYGDTGDLDDDDSDDDERQPKVDASGRPIEPTKVEDEFPDYEPIQSILNHLSDEDRVFIVEELELDLVPLELAFKIIPDDYYWERQARDRWKVFDINDHGKSWRRLFMEKHAWDAIEKFHPADDDLEKLKEDLQLVAPEVLRLNIQNLIPICFGTPAKEVVVKTFDGDNQFGADNEFDVGFGDELSYDDPEDLSLSISEKTVKSLTKQSKKKNSLKSGSEADYFIAPPKRNPDMDRKDPSHIDFSVILPLFVNLKELSMVYEMVETGLDWEDRFFKFTDKDCLNLANALAQTPSLEKFQLLRSRVTGEQCKTLVREGLIKMPHLKYINLNYNRIGDDGARAVARLLVDEQSRAIHTIHTIKVARNRIHNRGAKALAYALTRARHLAVLDLRMNSFGDSAGMDFGHALVKNTTLMGLFLAGNKLTEESAYIFGKMLYHNKSLKELDFSSNDIGKKGGEFFALGMRNNKHILRLDVRLCNIGLDFEYDVGTHLKKNRNRISPITSIVDSDDYYPPEAESIIMDLEEYPTDESEEEDDEEEEVEVEDEDDDHDDHDDDDNTLKDPNAKKIEALLKAAGGGAGLNLDATLKDLKTLKVVKPPQKMTPSTHRMA